MFQYNPNANYQPNEGQYLQILSGKDLYKHPMVRTVYRFHMYYHMRRVLKRLQVPLSHKTSFNATDNPYTKKGFFKICEDYKVPHDPRDEKFYLIYQRGIV